MCPAPLTHACVLALNDGTCIGHATVADLNCAPVKYLMQLGTFWEELLPDFACEVVTFLLYGGLNQVIFLRQFLFGLNIYVFRILIYSTLSVNTLAFSASL